LPYDHNNIIHCCKGIFNPVKYNRYSHLMKKQEILSIL